MTPYIHTYHVNIRDGADIRRERHPLASGDKNADTFVVYLRDHDSIVNLSGAGVSGKVIRPDGQTVPLTGQVVNGAAQVTLDEACYEVPGEIKLTVTVSAGNMTQSVLIVMMDVQTCETSVIVDNGVIGTLSDLLAEIANMRAATSAANAAANRANQAADFYDSGIRAAMLNGVITDGIVPYWGSSAEMEIGRESYPAENIGVVRHGGTAVLTGTATASVRVTMSGDLARTATNADFSALARTVDLVYGREYELEIRLISGSITGTDLRCIVYDTGTNAVASAVLDAAATGRGVTRFTWENGVTDAIIALRIPEGMSFTDCEVCCVLTDVAARAEATADTTARAAVKALEETHDEDYAYTVNLIAAAGAQSVNEASKKVAALSDDLTPMLEVVDPIARDSEGHFYPIIWTNTTEITTYAEVDGVISEHTSKPLGSGIMPCPKNLFFEFANSSSRLWLYFYTANGDGTYTPNWDILNLTTSTNLKNYLNSEYGRKAIRDIPDGLYIQAAVAAGDVKVYGWDGESFGPPLTSNTNIITTSGNTNNFMADGNGSVIVPGDSRYLVVTDNRAKLRAGIAVKDGVSTYLGSSETEFIVLPEGYDYFMFRLDPNAGVKMSWTGDASKYVSAVCRMQRNRMAETGAQYVIDAAKMICGFSWTPAAQIRAQGASKPFYPGVQYNGIPYGSGWQVAHFVGWHVSPHTFLNAVADDASIMVAEGLGDGGEAPYYSTVCSAFAVMAAGWPHPVLNDGMAVNPRVKLVRSVVPPIGAVWSNVGKSGGKHCVIPERIDYIGENVRSYSSYEGLPAASMRTTRYSNITTAGDKTGFKLAAGSSYFDAYGAAAYHIDAVRDMSNIPYWDADTATVTGGSARPYRGDKSVYTSMMDSVLINIKDPEATLLLLRIPEGGTYSIDINGETQIDVKKYTISDGIYYVYTNTSVVEESFEYVNVVPYNCSITNGQAVFDRNDFWYAYTKFRTNPGNAYYPHTKDIYVNIPSNSGGDYSDWASVGRCYDVVTVFCKGQYGAYTVPCNTTVINNVPESGGSISLDTTLTQPGMAADAAAVGEAVNGLAEEIEALKESGGSGGGAGGIVTETDPTVPAWAKQPNPPTYTAEQVGALPNTYVPPDQTAEQVGADPAGTAVAAVGEHNTNEDAHNDIRLLLADLDKRLGTLADSDDTTLDQLSEIVAYIKSNKSLIDGITTGKISTADIVDNLTTNAANKPLSAAQGVELKKLIDAIVVPTKLSELSDDATHRLTTDTEKATWNAKSTFSGKYEDLTGKPTIPTVTTASITSALGYTPANAETVTELSEEIDAIDVPTKVSALENDAGYIDDSTLAAELAKRSQLKPEFANSVEECTDTSKLYVLPDGYIYAYMYTEVTAEGGNNNLAVPKISTDTSDPDAWLEGYRFSTSSISTQTGGVITNRIPCKLGDTIYIKGLNVNVQLGSSYARIRPYNGTDVVNIGSLDAKGIIDNGYGTVNGDLTTLRMVAEADPDYDMSSNAFDHVRLNGSYMSGYTADTVKITVNEEYKETPGGTIKEYAWASTGHAFVPADYEDRIVDLEESAEDHEARLKLLEANESGSGVPAYWLEELESKSDAIQIAMEAAGRNKSAFLWYTDAHWPHSAKVSPALLDYLMRNTPMCKVNFGGDIVGDPNPHSHDNIKYVYDWRRMIAGLPNHHSVPGNHDLHHNTTDVRNMAYAYLLAPEESPDMVMGGELYYYIDSPAEKTRYIYLDYMTNDHDAMEAQGQFVVDAIKGVQDGWHIVVIGHRWFQYTSAAAPTVGSVPAYEAEILSVLDAYNARTSWSASNYFDTQDFSGAKGKVEMCIGGHIHVDYDFASTGGIPVILTASDTNQERSSGDDEDSGTAGTTTESAVYGIVADYTNGKISVIGVGRGGSREITI